MLSVDSITGMAIASQLPKGCDITIVARNLPGDPESHEWSSPWAGAIYMSKLPSSEWEQKMEWTSFQTMWKLAYMHPESSVRRIDMWDIVDFIPKDQIWYMNKMPEFRILSKDELPEGAPFGMAYKSVVLTPQVFLPWLKRRLEASGVVFKRLTVSSLKDLKGMGHDVLINASGVGAKHLRDSADTNMRPVRGQTILVKSDLDKIFIRRGKDYTYALPRGDGTVILGGIKQHGSVETAVNKDLRANVSLERSPVILHYSNDTASRSSSASTSKYRRHSLRRSRKASPSFETSWVCGLKLRLCGSRRKSLMDRRWCTPMVIRACSFSVGAWPQR